MPSDIILIGPVRAGKSTLGKLMADELGLPQVSLDKVRYDYYKEIGYDENHAREIRLHGGFLAFMYYRELFAAYAVERMLADYHNCVFDFGAGIFESNEMFARVQKALLNYPNVVLLLPSPNVDESLRVLAERDSKPPQDVTFDLTAYFLKHHTYYDLARITIYTYTKTPQESCHEILKQLGRI